MIVFYIIAIQDSNNADDDEDEFDHGRHSSSEPSRFDLDDSDLLLDAKETAASAAAFKQARRESFRLRSQESMRNPTPEMIKQVAAMKRRASTKSPARHTRRATPQ